MNTLAVRSEYSSIKALLLFALLLQIPTHLLAQAPPAGAASVAVPKLGDWDVVGLRLGTSPKDVVAAIKAANPELRIDVLNQDLELPGSTTAVPRWIIAHTFGPPNPAFYNRLDGSEESIGILFTLPPDRPVAGNVTRYVRFANGKPVAAANLIEALRKKYGMESTDDGNKLAWLYDITGKQIMSPTNDQIGCIMPSSFGYPMEVRGGESDTSQPGRRYGGAISELATQFGSDNLYNQTSAKCAPYTVIQADMPAHKQPGALMQDMWVTMHSAALLHNSEASTRAWIHKAVEDQIEKQKNAGAQRGAPKL